jgi:anthranilate synthase component II
MGARILVIDNYDSFTYNLVQEFGELGASIEVVRNDQISVAEVAKRQKDAIVLSPGPGRPSDAGITEEILRQLAGTVPIFGVCLGHQAIGEVYGASIVAAPSLVHGKTSPVHHDNKGVFYGLADPFTATRYHSLVITPTSIPDVLEVSARTDDGVVMGVRHKHLPVEGVQFHPESILTAVGLTLLGNFLNGL